MPDRRNGQPTLLTVGHAIFALLPPVVITVVNDSNSVTAFVQLVGGMEQSRPESNQLEQWNLGRAVATDFAASLWRDEELGCTRSVALWPGEL